MFGGAILSYFVVATALLFLTADCEERNRYQRDEGGDSRESGLTLSVVSLVGVVCTTRVGIVLSRFEISL